MNNAYEIAIIKNVSFFEIDSFNDNKINFFSKHSLQNQKMKTYSQLSLTVNNIINSDIARIMSFLTEQLVNDEL